jgi:cytochrome P450
MLPKKLVAPFSPTLRRIFALVDEGLSSLKAYQSTETKSDGPVVFDSLQHLSDEAAAMEAVVFLFAGSDTTAFTLVSAVWHICHNPSIKHKLASTLEEAFPEQREGEYPALLELESIPYLVACMKESLRVAMAVPGRLPRVVPGSVEPLVVDDKVVPPGTAVGMSAYTMHNSEELWGPNARHFQPERWLGEDAKGLDEHLVTFSKGARNCTGQTLAQANLLLMFFMLFRNFDIELDGASEKGFVTKDVFTQNVQGPGLLLRMRRI